MTEAAQYRVTYDCIMRDGKSVPQESAVFKTLKGACSFADVRESMPSIYANVSIETLSLFCLYGLLREFQP